jgi:hypothetical protein
VLKPHLTERVKVAQGAAKSESVFDMGDDDAIYEFNAVYNEIAKRLGIKP